MERKSGVLMHISSLYGDFSIGCFNDSAKYFINFLKECGFSYWQVLPFCPVDKCNSPYKSASSFAGNPYFIDLEKLNMEGLITDEELDIQRQHTQYLCEYKRLYNERIPLLYKASKRVGDKSAINNYINSNEYLLNFCKFMAIKKANKNKSWYEWENEVCNDDDLFFWKFVQYKFFTQWSEVRSYANKNGIRIIGDMPFYVDLDSSDVWGDKNLFKLNEKNLPNIIAGVPPDYFSSEGQLWGNPIYDWDEMEKDDFRWWKDRIIHLSNMFDGIRIDHFRAIESFWEVPANSKTAKTGKMTKGPGMKLIDEICKSAKETMIIAEDLGIITQDVRRLLEKSGFPGMRVFQFAFVGDKNSPHLPHNYINNCVAYTGTHDNNTLLGYLWETEENIKDYIFSYCGNKDKNIENAIDDIIRMIFASGAGTVILPIQDLLKFGSDTRINTPGKAEGNWGYRITKEQLDTIDRIKYRKLNELYQRI